MGETVLYPLLAAASLAVVSSSTESSLGGESKAQKRLSRVLDACPSGFETKTLSICDLGTTSEGGAFSSYWPRRLRAAGDSLNCSLQTYLLLQDEGGEADEALAQAFADELIHLTRSKACRMVLAVLLSRTSPASTAIFASAERSAPFSLRCPSLQPSLRRAVAPLSSDDFHRRINASLDWLLGRLRSESPCADSLRQTESPDVWNFYAFSRHTKELIAGALLTGLGIAGALMCAVCALCLSRGSEAFARRREAAAKKAAAKAASLHLPARYAQSAASGDAQCQILIEPPDPNAAPTPSPVGETLKAPVNPGRRKGSKDAVETESLISSTT